MDNSGPAFPTSIYYQGEDGPSKGMTLRDYFAAKALGQWAISKQAPTSNEEIVKECYALADAMLAERSK